MQHSSRPLVTYYGDDFTGSTDVLEVLTLAGFRTLLFLEPPTPEVVAALEDVQAIGVAGTGRSMTPEEMDEALPPIFERLLALRAPLFHYKTCSTFDSAPEIGCIGRALDLGLALSGSRFVPLVVGAPRLGRYCAFGNLFARSGPDSDVVRLDRHPTMCRHPVTPMGESDLRAHLAQQTNEAASLFDVLQYTSSLEEMEVRLEALLDAGRRAVLFDVLYEEHLAAIGRLIWRRTGEAPLFAVGSSGIEYALAAHWSTIGVCGTQGQLPPVRPVDQLIVISGSCSPITERQIANAARDGFTEIPLDTPSLLDPEEGDVARARAETLALEALAAGRSVIIHTARGPCDPRVAATISRMQALESEPGTVRSRTSRCLNVQLTRMLLRLLDVTGLRRVVLAGGDTSGHVAQALGLVALEAAAILAPGTPLCRAYAPGTPLHGLEIAFKGGQMGKVDFFTSVRAGLSSTGETDHANDRTARSGREDGDAHIRPSQGCSRL